MDAYVDTSALAKWYLEEPSSDEFADWIQRNAPAAISTLTVLEMRSLLARRRREGEIDAKREAKVFAIFEQDIAQGHLTRYPLEDGHVSAAVRLIASLPDHPLRSLDALHVAVAKQTGAKGLATADRVMARVGKDVDLAVIWFGDQAARAQARGSLVSP